MFCCRYTNLSSWNGVNQPICGRHLTNLSIFNEAEHQEKVVGKVRVSRIWKRMRTELIIQCFLQAEYAYF